MRHKILITTAIVLGLILLAFVVSLAIGSNDSANGNDDKSYCTTDSRNAEACITLYKPVCGWFSENIKCIKYPCAQTYSNLCEACKNIEVSYFTEGECPE